MVIQKSEVRKVLESSNGRWMTVAFVKRTTGEIREMTCRTGVSQHVKGVGMSFDPAKKNLMVVWEPKAGQAEDAYRMVNLDGVIWAQVDGKKYTVS